MYRSERYVGGRGVCEKEGEACRAPPTALSAARQASPSRDNTSPLLRRSTEATLAHRDRSPRSPRPEQEHDQSGEHHRGGGKPVPDPHRRARPGHAQARPAYRTLAAEPHHDFDAIAATQRSAVRAGSRRRRMAIGTVVCIRDERLRLHASSGGGNLADEMWRRDQLELATGRCPEELEQAARV